MNEYWIKFTKDPKMKHFQEFLEHTSTPVKDTLDMIKQADEGQLIAIADFMVRTAQTWPVVKKKKA